MNCCNDKTQDYEMWLGLIIFLIGSVFCLLRFDLIPAETWFYLWPFLLVVFGVKMMTSGGSQHCCNGSEIKKPTPMKKASPKKKSGKKRKIAKK